jgi:hypothetical protein
MVLKHQSTIIRSTLIITLNMLKKIRIWKLDDQNRPHRNKLKDKNYRGYGKSCLRIENHADGTIHFLCHLHDFLFLGMICHGLYNFCLLAYFLWGLFRSSNFQIRIFLCIFYAFFDTLPSILKF